MKNDTLFSSATVTSGSGVTSSTKDVSGYENLIIWLLVSAASGTLPTLDITIEHSPDGTNWYPLFTIPQITAALTQAYHVLGSADPFGQYLRGKYTVGGSGPSFTFSLATTAKTREAFA